MAVTVRRAARDALRLLRRLGDETTTRRFLHEIATAHYSGNENAETAGDGGDDLPRYPPWLASGILCCRPAAPPGGSSRFSP